MNKLILISTAVVCFVLGTAVAPLTSAHAQVTQKPLYYSIDFCKTKPGVNSMEWQEEWKPIHQDLINAGILKSWVVLQPAYTGEHTYDFITIQTFEDFNAYHHTADYASSFKKHWGDKAKDTFKQSIESRQILASELWKVAVSAQ